MTHHNSYPEVQALRSLFQKHTISITKLEGHNSEDLIWVSFQVNNSEWRILVDDEYHDFDEGKPLLCLFLVLFSLSIYDDCDDFLNWCNQWNLNTSDPKWLDYYRGLGQTYRDIEKTLGTVDPQITALDYQLRTGVIQELIDSKI